MLHNFVASLSAPLIKHSDDRVGILKFGSFNNDDGNGNEKVKNVTGLLSKTSVYTCITLFCSFRCRHCTTYDVKMPNFTLNDDVNKRPNRVSKTQIHFKCDVFAAFAVVDVKAP